MKKELVVVDFETYEIKSRPEYPPKPVGVAIQFPHEKKPVYHAWGHPSGNNTTLAAARRVVASAFTEYTPVFHNSAFDIDVAMTHLGVKMPQEFEDTLFLAFLHDPRDQSLSLKPLAAKYLDMPATEQDTLKRWIIENVTGATEKNFGAYIARAPGDLVGKYAVGDVVRTKKLFKLFFAHAKKTNMLDAYAREKQVLPIVLDMERRGLRIDVDRLTADIPKWEIDKTKTEKQIYRKIGKIDLDKPSQLADALDAHGLVEDWIVTKKSGKRSVARKALEESLLDKGLLKLLSRRSVLNKYLSTYGYPWLERARATGVIHPRFNQIRGRSDTADAGTYTGRFSISNPGLQATPKEPEDKTLPVIRSYIIPFEGELILDRDYNQQEFRILAHYEQGALQQEYLSNPKLDMHEGTRQLVFKMLGVEYARRPIKIMNFGLVYGMGIAKLAASIEKSPEETRALKAAILNAVPGIKRLGIKLRQRADSNEPIITWGGRRYFCEPPKMVDGEMRTFEYKLLNTLIQGSAADCTKQAMINVAANCDSQIFLQVHDQLVISCPIGKAKKEMARMKEAMEAVKFDIPMLSDGKWSRESWGQLTEYPEDK